MVWSRRLEEKKFITRTELEADELTLKKTQFALEQSQSKRKVLIDYTKGKTIKELESEVEKARSDELAKQATWELEQSDIVIVGVSRTSKSPTCVYLAYRGYKAANVPFVPGVALPENIAGLKQPLKETAEDKGSTDTIRTMEVQGLTIPAFAGSQGAAASTRELGREQVGVAVPHVIVVRRDS